MRKRTCYWALSGAGKVDDMTKPLAEQTVLVTGGSSGVGRETARALARGGASVLLVSRGSGSGAEVAEGLKRETGNKNVRFYPADLSSQAEVRRVAAAVKKEHERLDVLVNNAGAVFSERKTSADGVELTFALDHLSYFLLTLLLLEPLLKSPAPRVVNVASSAANFTNIDFDDLMKDRRYRGFGAYSQAKLANILFTFQLERFLRNTPATANVMHPGLVASGFGGGASGNLFLRLTRPLAKTPAQGAATAVYLASSPEVEGLSGRYYIDRKPAAAPKTAYDRQVQARLWRRSRELVRLTEAEEAPLRQVTPKSERGFL